MSVRTAERTVTFRHPFSLRALGVTQPPGTYRVVTDDEEIPGLSFVAYRRVATMLYVPAIPCPGSQIEVHNVDPAELDAALKTDDEIM